MYVKKCNFKIQKRVAREKRVMLLEKLNIINFSSPKTPPPKHK